MYTVCIIDSYFAGYEYLGDREGRGETRAHIYMYMNNTHKV